MPLLLKKIADEYRHSKANAVKTDKEKKYILIYKILVKMIIKVEIPENTLLPPTRKLAEVLSVSRSTILRVYDILILDGLIIPTQGSGYQIKPKERKVEPKQESIHSSYPSFSKIGKSFLKLGPNLVANSGQDLAFSPGLPPLDIFPVNQWKNLSNKYWKEIKFSNLSYSPSSGMDRLKNNIANYLKLTRNIHCDPVQVIIVSGSLQSIYLLGSILLNPRDKVILEDPSFPNVSAILTGLMANIIGAPLDTEGIDIAYLNKNQVKAKLIHVTPSCQYPMGIKMSEARREELVAFASKNKSLIIENDYEHELHNYHKPLPAIYSLDKESRTIYLGTFNRMLHPSLRIGYMVVPHHLKAPLEIMLKHSHRFVAPSIQFVLNQFIEKKYLHSHVLNLIETVSERASFFKQNFTTIFQDTPLQLVENETLSLQTLIQLNEEIKEEEILKILTQNNISAHSLHKCYLTPTKQQGLIMGHCSIPKPIIKNKLNRMRNILDNCIFAP